MDFSSNKDYKVALKGTEIGLLLPNWLTSGIIFLVGIILLVVGISFTVSLIKDKEFNRFIDVVKQYGEVEYIGSLLADIPKNQYVKKGELRIDKKIFFYFFDGKAQMFPTAYITSIQPKRIVKNNNEKFFIDVNFQNEIVEIETSKKQLPLLMEEITLVLNT